MEPTIDAHGLVLRWRRFALVLTDSGAYVAETAVTGDFADREALRISARRIRKQDGEEWVGVISFDHPSGARIVGKQQRSTAGDALDAALQSVLAVLSGPVWCDLDEATSGEERLP